jgi:hypothetical protein
MGGIPDTASLLLSPSIRIIITKRATMRSTSRIQVRNIAGGILAVALGVNGWTGHVDPTPTPAAHVALPQQESLSIWQAPAPGPHSVLVGLPNEKTWNKTKHWLKRNAPIVGGAGGGAIIGGLAGGGAGAIIGGAAGGGGGYLYKRHKQNKHHEYPQNNYQHEHH